MKHRQGRVWMGGALAILAAGALSMANGWADVPVYAATSHHAPEPQAKIQHVVYVIMDNVHLADIRQMPHVMQFLQQGTLFTNDHTILDSHTQDGMLSDMTGKYPSQTGVPDQSYYANGKHVGFSYWDSLDPDGQPHVTTAPPWKTMNAHGWSVGAIGAPDMELESSAEVTQMSSTDQNPADYLGVSVHSADGQTVLGAPNLPYVFGATSWVDANKTLGGFPGWGDTDPNWSLQATYEMQTHGVPVTFTYLHDVHEVNGVEVGPGAYGQEIAQYDQAFTTFFKHMQDAGMDARNTLFVLTTDEGDHYMPQGERTTSLSAWLANNSVYQSAPSNLNIIGDSGAMVYLKDQGTLPQTLSSLIAVPGWEYVADPTELATLHVSDEAAPTRTPSFILFSRPDVYYGYKPSDASGLAWSQDTEYLWNHGTISPDILGTWLGMVGPGVVQNNTSTQWLDHADTMPTVYALLGFNVAAEHFDGVPAVDALAPVQSGKHDRVDSGASPLLSAEMLYHALNAPVGRFSMDTLRMSTEASLNATNAVGQALDQQIAALTSTRNRIVASLQSDILSTLSGDRSSTRLNEDMAAARALLHQASL